MNGKILFYNQQTGTGIIITPEKTKCKFNIEEWDDFEIMPALGLEVEFTDISEDFALGITIKRKSTEKEDTNKKEIVEKEPLKKVEENLEKEEKPKPSVTLPTIGNSFNKKIQNTVKYKNVELTQTNIDISKLLDETENRLESINKNINLTIDILDTMHDYFSNIKKQIKKRQGYEKVDGRLTYSLAKRFLWTTFNNLQDIDPHVITLRIKSISEDLLFMNDLEEDFKQKIKYPSLTFDDIFLKSQIEYKNIKNLAKQTKDQLSFLREKEKSISFQKESIKKEILNCNDKTKLLELNKNKKVINGTYADTVHIMAQLQEEYAIHSKKLKEFEDKYKNDFNEKFKKEAKKYSTILTDILDAQAFLLDSLLWNEAKTSNPIQSYLKNLSIDIEFNTKEYLRYYLNTLDEAKSSQNVKELFTLYKHLQEIQKEYILIISANAEDALDYQCQISRITQDFKIKSFTDELSALKWSMKHNVKIIVIENILEITNAKKFLDVYHTNISTKPKIILIGNDYIHSNKYIVYKILSHGVTPQAVASTIKNIIRKKDEN